MGCALVFRVYELVPLARLIDSNADHAEEGVVERHRRNSKQGGAFERPPKAPRSDCPGRALDAVQAKLHRFLERNPSTRIKPKPASRHPSPLPKSSRIYSEDDASEFSLKGHAPSSTSPARKQGAFQNIVSSCRRGGNESNSLGCDSDWESGSWPEQSHNRKVNADASGRGKGEMGDIDSRLQELQDFLRAARQGLKQTITRC